MISNDAYSQAIDYYASIMLTNPRQGFFQLWHDAYTWKGRAVLLPLNLWGGVTVARGISQKLPTGKEKASWNTTFVDIPLGATTEDALFAQFDNEGAVYDQATKLLEAGYRLGFSYNGQNDAFICSVTCKDEASPNANKTFTAFAGSWYEALMVALYKHYVISSGDWSKGSSPGGKSRIG